MAAKKYSSTEILGKNGRPLGTRGIDGTKEKVSVKMGAKDVTVKIADAISEFVSASVQEKSFKNKKEKAAEAIRTFIGDVRKYFYDRKDFTKTFRVFGPETDDKVLAVDVSNSDKFTIPSTKEDIVTLRKTITVGVFNQIFEENAVIAIKKTVSDDPKKRQELTALLIKTLGEDKVKEYFERSVTYSVKPGLSKKIYEFPKATQEAIKEKVKAAADAIKDASTEKE